MVDWQLAAGSWQPPQLRRLSECTSKPGHGTAHCPPLSAGCTLGGEAHAATEPAPASDAAKPALVPLASIRWPIGPPPPQGNNAPNAEPGSPLNSQALSLSLFVSSSVRFQLGSSLPSSRPPPWQPPVFGRPPSGAPSACPCAAVPHLPLLEITHNICESHLCRCIHRWSVYLLSAHASVYLRGRRICAGLFDTNHQDTAIVSNIFGLSSTQPAVRALSCRVECQRTSSCR